LLLGLTSFGGPIAHLQTIKAIAAAQWRMIVPTSLRGGASWRRSPVAPELPLVDRVMQMLRTPAGQADDADVLSPRPRGTRLGWMFRPFAGRGTGKSVAPASMARPAAAVRAVQRTSPEGSREIG
jgi:hypothetical protein